MIPKIPKNIDDTFEKGFEKVDQLGQKTVENTTKQSEETTQAFLDQLYGPTTPTPEQSQTGEQQKQPSAETIQEQNPAMKQLETEQEKLAKVRQQLNPYDVSYHKQFDLEQTLVRVRQEREAEEAKKKQEEAEEEERKRQEEAAKAQQAPMPAGKKTGLPPGAKQKSPEVQDLDAQRARQAIENKSGFKG